MKEQKDISRRHFLKLAAVAGTLAGCGQSLELPKGVEITGTGSYNKEALLGLAELEHQPKIDQRIGVATVNPKYPREEGVNFFEWNAEVASRLGFQTVEIALVPQEFKSHTGLEAAKKGKQATLPLLAQREDIVPVFQNPVIQNVMVTAEVAGPDTVNAWMLPQEGKFTPKALEAVYQEYYQFASVMLQRFGGNGQEITITGPNELDWHALGGTPYALGRTNEDLPNHVITNTIRYLDAFLRGINDANRNRPEQTTPLKTAIEINRVRDIWNGKRRVLNAVFPNLKIQPDAVGYSSYGTLDKSSLFPKAIQEIQRYAPASQVMVSEFGIPENDLVAQNLGQEGVARLYQQRIQEAFDLGVSRFMIWQLACNETEGGKTNPDNSDCHGFWIVRPDGTLSQNYQAVRKFKDK